MRVKPGSLAHEVARIAGGQHGVISVMQLLAAGFTRAGIDRWVRKGLLHREYRGVYRVGHRAPSLEARSMAAVLASGPNAYLAGHAAAYLYGLVKGAEPPPEVKTTSNRVVAGVIVHRVRTLHPLDTTTYRAIRTLTVPATLIDLAATLTLDALSLACHQAEVRYHVTPVTVDAAMRRRNSVRGAPNLRAILHGDHDLLLSRMEKDFLALLRAEHLPLPKTNRKFGAHYLDCRWPEHHLTVELDSYRFHHSRHAWEQDRQRERDARARGDEHRRYTWHDVHENPEPMLADLRTLLPTTLPSPRRVSSVGRAHD